MAATSKTAKPTGMEHFTHLSPSIFVHEPANAKTLDEEPDLIVLAGWMGASTRNLSKYTAGYGKIYPSARIVVITTSTLDAAYRTDAANGKRVAPVCDMIYDLPPNAKFLLHVFSNGGSYTMALIAAAYRTKTGKAMPATAVVLDSTPGKATYAVTVRTFAIGLPKNILVQWIGKLLLSIFFWTYKLNCWIRGRKDLVEQARVDLNTKTLFDVNTPRLYLYSSVDPLVDWRSVEEHALDAEALGYRTSKEKFTEGGHCVHLVVDEKRYWGAVTKHWSSTKSTSSEAPP